MVKKDPPHRQFIVFTAAQARGDLNCFIPVESQDGDAVVPLKAWSTWLLTCAEMEARPPGLAQEPISCPWPCARPQLYPERSCVFVEHIMKPFMSRVVMNPKLQGWGVA